MHNRNPKWHTYSDDEKLRIFRAKFIKQVLNGERPSQAQDLLIDTAASLSLEMFRLQEEQAQVGKMPRDFVTVTNTLRQTLERLGCFKLSKTEGQNHGIDLSKIIDE